MALVTLKRYLDQDSGFRRVLEVIFKRMTAGAVRADNGEYVAMVAELERIGARLDENFSSEHALVAAGEAMQTLEEYNRHATQFMRRQGQELHKMIGMLAETVIAIAGSSPRSTEALSQITNTLEQANGLSDLHDIQSRLSACLEQVREESARSREETAATVANLQQHIRRVETRSQLNTDFNSVTDLPGRRSAESAVTEALRDGGKHYLVILVLNRLGSINARFGNGVGDQVLMELARLVRTEMPGEAQLFRWSGPTLVVLLSRRCPIEYMRAELNRVFNKPIGKEFRSGDRIVHIPSTPTWTVMGLVPPLETVTKHVDTFVAKQAPEEAAAAGHYEFETSVELAS